MEYSRAEAKERAFAKWKGVCNVILPSFTADLKRLNEKAIRHDVRRNIEHGFWGTLLVSECATTAAEYRQFMAVFDDVLVPWERVFLHADVARGNALFAATSIQNHTGHQTAIRGLAKCQFLTGLAVALTRTVKTDGFLHDPGKANPSK